jgi:hypothetical protein
LFNVITSEPGLLLEEVGAFDELEIAVALSGWLASSLFSPSIRD